MLPLSPRICQCMSHFFVKRLKFLAATSNLLVEQNLVHLGRFLHFSQKVVGVTLKFRIKTIFCHGTKFLLEKIIFSNVHEISKQPQPRNSRSQESLKEADNAYLAALNYNDFLKVSEITLW